MIVSKRLKEIRVSKKFTQKQIATLLNLNERTYRNYESGNIDLSTVTIIKLCNYYNVSADYLLGLSNDPNGTVTSKDVELIKQYYSLNDRDKQLVNTILGLNR